MKRLGNTLIVFAVWQWTSLLFVQLLLLPMLCSAQEGDEAWDSEPTGKHGDTAIEYGVDCSWPMQRFPIRHPNRGTQRHVAQRYIDYMDGCYQHYSKEECRTSDQERMAMNLHQPQAMQNYTSAGYAKVKAPEAVMEILSTFYEENKNKKEIREKWPPGAIYTNHWRSPTRIIPLEGLPNTENDNARKGDQPSLTTQQRQQIIAHVQPILETWCKMPLIATSLYGIRIYQSDSILSPHVDRLPLVISAIINVAQEVSEPWPLELIGHDGKAVNVTMDEPGEMILYESATIIHGRPYPLNGQRYANVFLHFEPVGHTERHMGLRKDPKTLFEQALKKQESKIVTSKDEETHRKKQDALPYYVDPDKGDQWKQNYVYVKRPTNEKGKEQKKRTKQQEMADPQRRIHNLASAGNLKDIQTLVRNDPDVVTTQDGNGWTALHEAARAGHTHVVEYLVGVMDQESINIRTNQGKGATALWWAMHMHDENHPAVQVLIRHGAKSIPPKN